MTFGFDDAAGQAVGQFRADRDNRAAAAEHSAAEWEERRALTRHFIDAIRPCLQVVYARLVSEGIKPEESSFSSKRFMRTTHESLIWIGDKSGAGITNKQFGPSFRYINYVNQDGDFYWTQKIEFRRPGVHNDGGMNDVGRIERPLFRKIEPPRNAQTNSVRKAVRWSNRDDALEFTAYYIAQSIWSVPSVRNWNASTPKPPIVVDRSDGSIYFSWHRPSSAGSDYEDLVPDEQRVPTIVPAPLETIQDYVARAAARTIAMHRRNHTTTTQSSRRPSRL
ncbi:hypothetical protein [Gordonia sp. NPDC058843]|uniref:hypothetical protein n=1 Tax=Gordonia sp. NPDC058843 TaxID=3346648 RepID=UPI003693B17D